MDVSLDISRFGMGMNLLVTFFDFKVGGFMSIKKMALQQRQQC